MDMGFSRCGSIVHALFVTLLLSFSAQAEILSYYGAKVKEAATNPKSHHQLEQALHQTLALWHLPSKKGDLILEECDDSECFRHEPLTYSRARQIMFGQIHLFNVKGTWGVEDVYCDVVRMAPEFGSTPPGPDKIPNPQIMNAEHTWPQSRFTSEHSKDLQKSDLHSLYPVFSRVNSSRSNDPFAEVDVVTSEICPGAKKGLSRVSGRIAFEPPDSHKGNVARALFYFAIRYEMDLDAEQESFLRTWHKLDPVDEFERTRHEQVFSSQKNRNPFVDHPEWADLIADF
jgi:deoxyribonuclease-1